MINSLTINLFEHVYIDFGLIIYKERKKLMSSEFQSL